MNSRQEQSLRKYSQYLLGRRAYSISEMKEKILQKIKNVARAKARFSDKSTSAINKSSAEDEISPDLLINSIIQYLVDLKLLDDEAYAKTLAESLLRQNKSSRVIENKLKQKGIEKEIVEKVFAKDEVKEKDSLAKLIDSKLRHSPDLLTSKKGKEKLIRFLLYRGFSYADIRKILDKEK